MKFADVKNDIAFRKIFGNENKKIILISFLNAVLKLQGDARIADVEILNPYQLPIIKNLKASIIDVRAKDERGNIYLVEMQVAEPDGMDKRLLYYTSKEYSQQIESGEYYTNLNPVIFIGIFEFDLTKTPSYLSHHAICDVENGERVIKDMDFFFIELPKFKKQMEDLDNISDKWIYFIKEAENLEVIPENVDDKGLSEAYHDAAKHNWTKEELFAYDYAAMRDQDERGKTELAVKRAVQKAVQEAVQQTEQKKESDFILQKKEMAKQMKADSVPIDTISKYTGLSLQEINEL